MQLMVMAAERVGITPIVRTPGFAPALILAAQLRELGVGYTNCAPAPEVRMLRSMQAQVAEARALLA